MGQRRVGRKRDRFLVCLFRFIALSGDDVEARQTEIRLNSLRIQLDRVIQFGKGAVVVPLREENAAHQNVTFDVIGIALESFFRELFSFGEQLRAACAGREIVVAEFYARIEMRLVVVDCLLQLGNHFRQTL